VIKLNSKVFNKIRQLGYYNKNIKERERVRGESPKLYCVYVKKVSQYCINPPRRALGPNLWQKCCRSVEASQTDAPALLHSRAQRFQLLADSSTGMWAKAWFI